MERCPHKKIFFILAPRDVYSLTFIRGAAHIIYGSRLQLNIHSLIFILHIVRLIEIKSVARVSNYISLIFYEYVHIYKKKKALYVLKLLSFTSSF